MKINCHKNVPVAEKTAVKIIRFTVPENKGADELGLCFCYIDNTIPFFPKSEISSLYSHLLWLYTARFVSDLVVNSEDRFSGEAAQIYLSVIGGGVIYFVLQVFFYFCQIEFVYN